MGGSAVGAARSLRRPGFTCPEAAALGAAVAFYLLVSAGSGILAGAAALLLGAAALWAVGAGLLESYGILLSLGIRRPAISGGPGAGGAGLACAGAECPAGDLHPTDIAAGEPRRHRWPRLFAPIAGSYARRTALLAFATGMAIGVGAALVPVGRSPGFGMPTGAVHAVVGVVVGDARSADPGQYAAELELESAEGGEGTTVSASGRLLVYYRGAPTLAGSRVRAQGRLEGIDDEARSDGPVASVRFRALSLVDTGAKRAFVSLRSAARAAVMERFGNRAWGALAAALLIGARDNLDDELSDLFRDAGCAHVLALSGMHLSVVAALLGFALRPLLGFVGSGIVSCVLAAIYVFLAGAPPSLVRAALMFAGAFQASRTGGPDDRVNLLALVFCIHLLADPAGARTLSFILSYVALGGILVCSPVLEELARPYLPLPIASPLCASTSAFLATATIQAAIFSSLRPAGIVASLALVPAAGATIVLSVAYLALDFLLALSGIAAPVVLALRNAVALPVDLLYRVSVGTAAAASRIPAVPIASPWPVAFASLAAFVLLVYVRDEKNVARMRYDA